MCSRDLRAARAARSARSTSPAKPRSSTLKNGTQAAPLQTRSLQTFQVSLDDLESSRASRETRQHTLPSVSRKRRQASTESRKSAVDDFHCEYDYAQPGSEKLATDIPYDANNEDFARYRRDNLSQDSYRVSDSRESSTDRLEMRTKPDVDAEFIGTEPLDEAKLIQKLEQEQQLQESQAMEEQDAGDLRQNDDDICKQDNELTINGDDVHVIKAEWDLPESCLQTEVEKIVSIETTRIVETVETTRVTPLTETYRRQKRLSRENAVRVVDEDMTSSPSETETCAVDTTDSPGPAFAVPMSFDLDESQNKEVTNEEQIRSFVVSLINDAIKKTAEEMNAVPAVEESVIMEPTKLGLNTTEKSESTLPARDDRDSTVEQIQEQLLRVAVKDGSSIETLALVNGHYKVEAENVLEESKQLELSRQNSEDAAKSQKNVAEAEVDDVKQGIDETSHKLLDTATRTVFEKDAQPSPSDVASPGQQVLETAELPKTYAEYALSLDQDNVQQYAVIDQQTEQTISAGTSATAEEIPTSASQTFASSETERHEIQEAVPVNSAEVCQSEQLPDEAAELRKDAVLEPAAETSEDIPYVLHKRHIIPAVEKPTGDTRLYATLPTRHHPSRSRSLSPSHKKPVILTSEQKKAQMMKVKASLVSMAAEMAAPRSPKSPVGIGALAKRAFDVVVCSRLPPRDSFSSRDDTLSPPDEHDVTLVPRDKKAPSTEKKPAHQPETKSSQLLDMKSVADTEKSVDSESEPAIDLVRKGSTSEPSQLIDDSQLIEVSTVHETVSLNVDQPEGAVGEKHTTEVEKLQTGEGLESESDSEGKAIGDEVATAELEDEVNRLLSECELNVAAEDNGSLASGVSGKFTDESPEVETNRRLEATLRTGVMPIEGTVLSEDGAGISLSPPDTGRSDAAAVSYDEKPLLPSLSGIETDSSEHVAECLPVETKVRPPFESHELSGVDQSVNGIVTQPDDYQLNETDTMARGGVIADSAAELAAAEQRLLLELQANELAAPADNISSSSHSLNDQLDAEVLQSFANVPSAVDAACRLSDSSVDGSATRGFGRNVHLLDWLEEQAQLRGVSVSPHGAEGHPDAFISDEDDVEHAVFEDNLQDIFAALEAEVMANPFLVPITPQTSDMCVNPMTSERFSFEDDSSLGVLEASGGIIESAHAVDAHHRDVLALSDEGPKQSGAAGITEVEGNIRHSQLSLSISSEGDVIVEHVDDLTDPLEILEIESRALPLQLLSKPVYLSSDSESLSDECREQEKLQDVADVLDRVDETRRLSISDLEYDEPPLEADVSRVPLPSDTSSGSSVEPVCVEEEADAFVALDKEDNPTAMVGDAEPGHSNSDEEDADGQSASSSSAVDSDPAVLGNFVEQVMLHHSAGSEVADGDEVSTELQAATEHQFQAREAADENTAVSEYTLTPSCDTDILSNVAQEVRLSEVLELPQGAEALVDTAISDEDDVEHGIEGSLQDVFAALEAEVMARQCSVPVTTQTSIVIGQDSFDDDTEASSDVVIKTSRCEADTSLAEFSETAATTDADVLLRNDSEELQRVSDEHVTTEDSRHVTAGTDFERHPSPDDVNMLSEAAAVEVHRAISAAVELIREDLSSEPALPAFTRDVEEKRDETSEQSVQEDATQRETNRKESGTDVHLSHDSLVATKATAERIAETETPHAAETPHSDSESTEEVHIEDNGNERVTAETHCGNDEKVNTEADVGNDGTEAGTCEELATGTEDIEEMRTDITDASNSADQSL